MRGIIMIVVLVVMILSALLLYFGYYHKPRTVEDPLGSHDSNEPDPDTPASPLPPACPGRADRREQVSDAGVREMWCDLAGAADEEPARVGPYRAWYAEGARRAAGQYRANLKNGAWRRWHENGRLVEETIYQGGVRHGRSRTWDPDGRLADDVEYRDGKPMR